MPVTRLYCEGAPKSPDIIVLSRILAGVGCLVKPSGGKYGFGQRVLIHREEANPACAGLLDRDFDDDLSAPTGKPRDWTVEGGRRWLGWTWERREIENYLVDPVVVRQALADKAPEDGTYRQALQAAATSVAEYTAARYALSLSRVRFSALPNDWGPERGKESHRFPEKRSEQDCRQSIERIVNNHEQCQLVQVEQVMREFEEVLPTCRAGGIRFKYFLTFFAGKDLLYALEPNLLDWGFQSAMAFRARVLKGIQTATEVWRWLPEWTALRTLVQMHPV